MRLVSNTFWTKILKSSHCAPVKDYDSYSLGAKRLFLKPATALQRTEKSKARGLSKIEQEILNSTKGKAISAIFELYLRPWDCLELQEITAQLCGMDE